MNASAFAKLIIAMFVKPFVYGVFLFFFIDAKRASSLFERLNHEILVANVRLKKTEQK